MKQLFLSRLLGLLSFTALIAFASDARAVYQCDGQTDDCVCGLANPFPCCDNGGGAAGNCTWWAWESACCGWKVAMPSAFWGNAKTWAAAAASSPDYDLLTYPVVGSVACRDIGTYGHVAWVTAVNGANITVSEMNCCANCNNGVRNHDYAASYFTGGYIVRHAQVECTPAKKETADCGNCGSRSRTCSTSGKWGAWTACSGEGVCKSGDPQSQACGNCGTQTRSCTTSCAWPAWGTCSGEGACKSGSTESKACGDCGNQSRTCSATCQWSAFTACEGTDSKEACDTGKPGVCAKGLKRCVAGKSSCEQQSQATTETCDKLDNDCDGQTDEGVCDAGTDSAIPADATADTHDGTDSAKEAGKDALSDGLSASDGPQPDSPGIVQTGEQSSGCGCKTSSNGKEHGWSILVLSLLVLGLKSRRRSANKSSL